MSETLWTTVLLAAAVMALAVLGLGIGLFVTGKSRLRRGCGWTPGKKKDEGCSLCGSQKPCDKKDNDER